MIEGAKDRAEIDTASTDRSALHALNVARFRRQASRLAERAGIHPERE